MNVYFNPSINQSDYLPIIYAPNHAANDTGPKIIADDFNATGISFSPPAYANYLSLFPYGKTLVPPSQCAKLSVRSNKKLSYIFMKTLIQVSTSMENNLVG